MSGHSKWATIKHKKGALDAKRGKIFTRLIKEISIAAKNGGGDPDTNPRLRGAILGAKAENMPADNIKRAIQRGTGELPGANYEEFSLEGYGPGGVAVLLDINTDNRNRTVSEIRHVFGKNGGNMADAGAVSWMFHKKGDIIIPKSAAKEDDLMNIVLEHGGEEGRHRARLRQRSHDPPKLHQTGRRSGQYHDPLDGSPRRSGRRAKRSFQLRHRPETVGRSRRIVLHASQHQTAALVSGGFSSSRLLLENKLGIL